jgi:HAD superfamily hydrolase (TIGR01509 family)
MADVGAGMTTSSQDSAVLFDLDGTLVDSNDFHVAAWQEAFVEAGFDIPAEAIRGQIGKGSDNLLPAMLPDVDEAIRHPIGERTGEIYKARYMQSVQPFPGARELLERVRATGAKVALASSASGAELDHYVELLDAAALLDVTTSADDVEHSKPDPDIFAAALRKAGVAAGRAVVIGDTPYDVEAAAKCGIAAIAVLSGGFPERDLRAAGAVAIYADVAALLADYVNSPCPQ